MGVHIDLNSISKRYAVMVLAAFFCLLISQSNFAEPLIPTIKVVHVGKHQELSIPIDSRFQSLGRQHLNFKPDLSSSYWIKPTLTNGREFKPGDLFTINPTSLDMIDMYIPEIAGTTPVISSGRFDINTQAKFSRRSRVFEIPDNYKTGQTILFYVSARNSGSILIKYWEHDEYLINDRKYNSIYSAVYASLFILILINFIFYLAIGDDSYLRYVFYLACFLLFILMTTGKIYDFSGGRYIAGSYNASTALFALTCFSFILFAQGFLKLKEFTPKFYRFTQMISALLIVLLIVALFITPVPYISFSILNFVTLFCMPLCILAAIYIWTKGHRPAKYFFLAFIPLFLFITLRIFAIIEVLPEWRFAVSGFQIAIVFQALILSLGLADRIISLRQQRDDAQDHSDSVSSLIKKDKDFSKFLSTLGSDVRSNPTAEHDEIIIYKFFERLESLFNINKGAIIFQIESELKVLSNSTVSQTGFDGYVHDHVLEISRICHAGTIDELTIYKHPFFSRFSKMLILPVNMRGHEWSCMVLNIEVTRQFTSLEMDTLQKYSTELIRTLVNAEKIKDISKRAETDHLTQVLNRGAILDVLNAETDTALISALPLSIAFLDIDHFKLINDTYGHEAGDTCLSYLALQCRRYLPKGAYVGRMGGDEFLFVFPNFLPHKVKESLEITVASIETLIIDDQECSFTLSIGIAQYKPSEMNVKSLLREADETLYIAKENGRNQITIAA